MAEYQTPEDMRFAKKLIAAAPAEAEAFFHLKSVTERGDGVIPVKYRELIALAVALTTQCSYCSIRTHAMPQKQARHGKKLQRRYSWPLPCERVGQSGTAC